MISNCWNDCLICGTNNNYFLSGNTLRCKGNGTLSVLGFHYQISLTNFHSIEQFWLGSHNNSTYEFLIERTQEKFLIRYYGECGDDIDILLPLGTDISRFIKSIDKLKQLFMLV